MVNNNKPIGTYALLFVPWLLSLIFQDYIVLSYFIAWLGSFYIFYITLTGKLRPLPNDRPVAEQLMRPIFLVQIIFAGYMCCTSIFYLLNLLGYEDFQKVAGYFSINYDKLKLTAQCQRYYCLGHAAFASGILVFMNYPVKKLYKLETEKIANLLLIVALASFGVGLVILFFPALYQFYIQLASLSFIAGTLALAFAIPLKKSMHTVVCLILYGSNFYQAFISGYKEPIIVSILVLAVFLYPNYKKLVTLIGVPILILMFVFLPAYVNSFREVAWSDDVAADDASQIALDVALNSDTETSNWNFLVFRLSEIDMFTTFVYSTPKYVNFYGTQLLKQSAEAIIPRVFWPAKATTEALIMQRVYDSGVINSGSSVSAKPAVIVDAYLSGGAVGIFLFLFIYGAAAQLISIQAEQLFGGYVLGTALIFTGLFQTFWRGLSIEFLVNTVFWSYVGMLIVFRVFKTTKILIKV